MSLHRLATMPDCPTKSCLYVQTHSGLNLHSIGADREQKLKICLIKMFIGGDKY